jgi:hypothetical protein
MKCVAHKAEAVAVCSYCGRAVCADCEKISASKRIVCSDDCAESLFQNEKALQLILQKSLQSAKASAFYCFLCGGLSLSAAIGAHFYLPSPFLIYFTAGCGGVFILSGIWYALTARKQNFSSKN